MLDDVKPRIVTQLRDDPASLADISGCPVDLLDLRAAFLLNDIAQRGQVYGR